MGGEDGEYAGVVKKFERIQLGTYPFDMLYTVGTTNEEIIAYLRKSGVELSDEDIGNIREHVLRSGWTMALSCGGFVLWLRKAPKTAYTHAVLAHEAFHITSFLFSRVNIEHSMASDEAWAYQIEFIVNSLVDKMFS